MAPRGKWPPFPWNPADLDNPLIGRDDALQALVHAFDDVVSDWLFRVQLLVSEHGMGKSRMLTSFVDAALAREPDTFVIRVKCPPTGGAYRLWDAIVREAFAIPAAANDVEAGAALLRAVERYALEDAAEISALIAYLVGYVVPGKPTAPAVGADQEALVAQCVGALGRLLEAIAFERPLLVVIAHANRASVRDFALASAIEATVKGRPIMMVFAGSLELTDHLPGWDRFPVIRLRTLERAEADRMLRLFLTGLPEGLPAALTGRILDAANGNAYALKSMVRYLHEAGGITLGEGEAGYHLDAGVLEALVIPENLEGVLHSRLGALSSEERHVLAQAAVVGREVWLGALVAIARQGTVGPATPDADEAPERLRRMLAKFVAQRFLEPRTSRIPGEEAFTFRSQLHWEAAQSTLPDTMRQRLHRVALAWLELQSEDDIAPFLADLARHAEGSGQLDAAADYYLRAARLALAEGQSKSALTRLEKALSLAPADQYATRLRALFELGEVHTYAGATDEALKNYRDALDLAWRMRDRKKGARALVRLADVEQAMGRYDDAHAHFTSGLRLYEAIQDQPGVASSCTALGRLHWLRGELEQALRCYRKSEHLYRQVRDERGMGEVLHAMAAVHYDRGDASLAERYYGEALELRKRANDKRGLVRTLNNIGIAWMGRDMERSVEMWRDALEIANEIGDLGLQATLADNLGEVLVLLGRHDEADDCLGRAVALAELTGSKRTLVDALRNQALLRIALGEWEGAAEVLERARATAASLGLPRLTALVSRATGDLVLARAEETGIIVEEGGDGLGRAELAFRAAADAFEAAGYAVEAADTRERLADTLELLGQHPAAHAERHRAASLRAGGVRAPTPPPVPVG
ncbi:MAG: tetratricopeptide repeat protein [Deltaproteobacteria bacterium]|nr:tetratricopeptide repeat protein [Deltaproteobacteria bacterium]